MKKILTVALLCSINAISSFGQGWYFNLGLGYAFPQATQTMYGTATPYNGIYTPYSGTRTNTAYSQTYSIDKASFSSGLQGGLAIGYMFGEHVGIQLDAIIGLSNPKYTFNDENVNLGTAASPLAGNIVSTQHASTPFFLAPSLVLQSGGEVFNIYTRFGLALPLNTKITLDQVFTNAPGTGAISIDDFSWEIKNSFSLGFTAAAGVKYKINDRISVFGELSLLSMAVFAKEQDLKNWTENGSTVPLSNYTNAQTIKFSKTAVLDSTFSQAPTYSQPFSNVGVNIGMSFSLSENNHTNSRHVRSDNSKLRDRRGSDDLIDHSKKF